MTDIQQLDAAAAERAIPELADMLLASVAQGASIGFVMPFTLEQAQAFWRRLLPAIERGDRAMLVARQAGRVVGTVQLLLDMPDNGRHRAEVLKLMVHPQARRQGIARQLMLALQRLAAEHRRHLLVLDTLTGDTAEGLYRRLGFELAGSIPQYAMASNGGALDATSYMYKLLPC
ncbi:GNAT family N-acetyltransferase [Serratia ficaria]|uniref:Acetyltransferase n=1 Tax=Serratia ficaria TaxID=61651 RepID=A0A240BMI1_SERFI|nr:MULTISPECIES: GNAT family N-acetyltransferase [Serratia]MEE4483692.1 GNAT family N-acetyltransferase [Serratia ficaria]REF45699.1 acetyltransferase (GNAT) family protein [Serratia ficaria]CAI0824326.1 Acetyltransferase [Serratia ficaria]CAI0858539.1 Acetyltransferase [Serratia ficaria]CAI0870536.1 Acetyltransferase [Serratia ficaria]